MNEKKSILFYDDVNALTYSRKSHLDFFRSVKYDTKLLRKKPDSELNAAEYQNLMVYSFIIKNLKKGDRILKIGNEGSVIFDLIRDDFECWELNAADLKKDTSRNGEVISIKRYGSRNVSHANPYGYFHLIFSNSAFFRLREDTGDFSNIIFNLNKLVRYGGFSMHNFRIHLKENKIEPDRLLSFLIQGSSSINSNNRRMSVYSSPGSVQNAKDIHYFSPRMSDFFSIGLQGLSKKYDKVFSYSIVQKKDYPAIPKTTITKPAVYLRKHPAYVFHHLMKCGGVSLGTALKKWFVVKDDLLGNYKDFENYLSFKYNLENISSDTCIRGHYYHEGIHWHQRYPEILSRPDEFKIFTFIRDPLKVKISLYYFAKNRSIGYNNKTLSQCIYDSRNFLASMIQCDETNYKRVMDRYFFVGIVENMQESFDKLAAILGKKKITVPVVNTSVKDSQISELTPGIINKFRDNNKLDYMIYEYCLERFLKL